MPPVTTVFDPRLRKDVDILFVIDNSPSMSPKQAALAKNIPKFIQTIDALGVNYHVGIVTSDIGADVAPGQLWGGTFGSCDTFAGDDGMLQAIDCNKRSFSTPAGTAACKSLCPDPRYVPTNGASFIAKVDGVTNVPVNLQLDPMTGKMVDQGPINAFQCMALVGDTGCGVEGQLESSIRALGGRNTGFLRNNSLLTVVYITDEDDCSVQLALRDQLNPLNRDCDPTKPDSYDCYNVDYRCLARSLQCNESMLTAGTKTGCKERPNNFLEPLQKYYNFFSSLRPADKLIISGIWTLPSITNNGNLQIKQSGVMPATTGTLNRATGTMASCTYAADTTIFGQAQYRLSQFAGLFGVDQNGAPNSLEGSICDIDNYPTALAAIAKKVTSKSGADCLSKAPVVRNGAPDCVVGYVDAANPQAVPTAKLPVCSATCCNYFATDSQPRAAEDPNLMPNPHLQAKLAACTSDPDCYCAVPSTVSCAGGAVAGMWRAGNAAPPAGKVVSFQCASQ